MDNKIALVKTENRRITRVQYQNSPGFTITSGAVDLN